MEGRDSGLSEVELRAILRVIEGMEAQLVGIEEMCAALRELVKK